MDSFSVMGGIMKTMDEVKRLRVDLEQVINSERSSTSQKENARTVLGMVDLWMESLTEVRRLENCLDDYKNLAGAFEKKYECEKAKNAQLMKLIREGKDYEAFRPHTFDGDTLKFGGDGASLNDK